MYNGAKSWFSLHNAVKICHMLQAIFDNQPIIGFFISNVFTSTSAWALFNRGSLLAASSPLLQYDFPTKGIEFWHSYATIVGKLNKEEYRFYMWYTVIHNNRTDLSRVGLPFLFINWYLFQLQSLCSSSKLNKPINW